MNKAVCPEINNLDAGGAVKSGVPMVRCLLQRSVFNFVCGCAARAEAPRGQWQSSERLQRQTAEPQLPQQCHGVIIEDPWVHLL